MSGTWIHLLRVIENIEKPLEQLLLFWWLHNHVCSGVSCPNTIPTWAKAGSHMSPQSHDPDRHPSWQLCYVQGFTIWEDHGFRTLLCDFVSAFRTPCAWPNFQETEQHKVTWQRCFDAMKELQNLVNSQHTSSETLFLPAWCCICWRMLYVYHWILCLQ